MTPPAADTPKPTSSGSRSFLGAVILLAGVLLLFFYRSLVPGLVLFSNDGPLGANSADFARMPAGWTGMWQDLNWVGLAAGAAPPSFTYAALWVVGPLGYAKFYAPLCLLLLGLSAWLFMRNLGFHPCVSVLGGIAASLNSDFFSYTGWGLGSLTLSVAAAFLALAALTSKDRLPLVIRLTLGGLATGLSVMEGFDSGAILSLFISAFVVMQAFTEPGTPGRRLAQGGTRVFGVALAACWIATYALHTLVGTQIRGVVGMEQDSETKAKRWVEATQWSLPRVEVLRVVVPGLFGYRMDTPDGGNYWGAVGRHPVWDEYLDSPNLDPSRQPDPSGLRHSGAGLYAGVLVVFMAVFGFAQAFRGKDNPFSPVERRWIYFWAGAAAVSLLLSLGRHAPLDLYRLTVYQLPYFSTIRNPIKFLHPFSLSLVILCGYGLEALWRRLARVAMEQRSGGLKAWWDKGPGFERLFARFGIVVLVAALLAVGLYASGRTQTTLVQFLEVAGFPNTGFATLIARFSLTEAVWSVFFLALSLGAVMAILAGVFRGPRAGLAAATLLGAILVADLYRANTPWILYWDYPTKYATNPVIEVLRKDAHERRVTGLFLNAGPQANELQQPLQSLYAMDWMQHLFLYYNIPCLDIIQMPRVDQETHQFKQATQGNPLRLWELTSTRYLIGLAGLVEPVNAQLDKGRGRFRPMTGFELQSRGPDAAPTAQTNANGPYAIIEFTGALPKASLYSQWEVINDPKALLQRLVDPAFGPHQKVLLDAAPAAPPTSSSATGTVSIVSYAPKHIRLDAEASTPSVLLYNDKFHPDWKAYVDGQPSALLRCNYIMRGVLVPAGKHTVEFRFEPSVTALYISLSAIATGLLLCGWLALGKSRNAGVGS